MLMGARHGATSWRRAPTRSWARCRGRRPASARAVNDTTRQMGGAVGVAVFGSLMASHFTTAIDRQARLGAARRAVRSGEGQRRPGASASRRRSPAAQPFRDADRHRGERQLRERPAHQSALVAAGITLLAAVGVALFLPARARDEVDAECLRSRARAGAGGGRPDDASATPRTGDAEVRRRVGRATPRATRRSSSATLDVVHRGRLRRRQHRRGRGPRRCRQGHDLPPLREQGASSSSRRSADGAHRRRPAARHRRPARRPHQR